jgi:hypothetical protein
MAHRDDGPFFIGFAPPAASLRRFLLWMIAVLIAGFAGLGWLIAATQDDPGDGAFRFDWGRQTVTGVLQATPYPILHVLESDRFPPGHTLLLSGQGKRGVQERADTLDGKVVTVSGVALKRGDLDMIQLRGGSDGISLADGAAPAEAPAPQPLGRWRITGEICDGKCYAGAMRPGTGLAHKSCANLCLIGGVPPVFVTTDTVEGEEFLLLANAEGGSVTDEILDHVAKLVTITGEVERRGDLLVFRIDAQPIRLAQ